MHDFRDRTASELKMKPLVHVNRQELASGIGPFTHGSAIHTEVMKTEALKQALDAHGFDSAFGGARRDEERARAARERSFRSIWQHLDRLIDRDQSGSMEMKKREGYF